MTDLPKEYFSELGKRSAAKRKQDKRFNKDYYAQLAQRSAASKRAKKKARDEGKKEIEPLPPFQMPDNSPISTLNKFLKGKL